MDEKKVKKGDFVSIEFTGYSGGQIFDSNIQEDLKKISPKAKAEETIVVVGAGMVVPGLDKAIEGKEIGKNYEIDIPARQGFGERKRDLIKIIPLNAFKQQNVNVRPGMVLALDNQLVRVLAISGARVTVDYNNPLAGKDLEYKFKILEKVESVEKKAEAMFKVIFRFVPEFEVKDKIIIKGPKQFENIAKIYSKKFKESVGKELGFELKEEKKEPAVK